MASDLSREGGGLGGISFNNQRSVGLYFIWDVTLYLREPVLAGQVQLVYRQLRGFVGGALGFYAVLGGLRVVPADLPAQSEEFVEVVLAHLREVGALAAFLFVQARIGLFRGQLDEGCPSEGGLGLFEGGTAGVGLDLGAHRDPPRPDLRLLGGETSRIARDLRQSGLAQHHIIDYKNLILSQCKMERPFSHPRCSLEYLIAY